MPRLSRELLIQGEPWEIEPWDYKAETLNWYRIVDEAGELIANVCRVPNYCWDHARLIEKAPEMYRALLALMENYKSDPTKVLSPEERDDIDKLLTYMERSQR